MATQYQLTIIFDQTALIKIHQAGQSVTIVQSVSSYVASALRSETQNIPPASRANSISCYARAIAFGFLNCRPIKHLVLKCEPFLKYIGLDGKEWFSSGDTPAPNANNAFVPPAVAWLVFSPFQQNTIAWSDEYYLYATVTPLQQPNVILINSMTAGSANMNSLYAFNQAQFIGSAGGNGAVYAVTNQMSGPQLYFGLAQQAQINGSTEIGPLTAVSVLLGQSIQFNPNAQVSIFLSSASDNGEMLPSIPQSALTFAITQTSVVVAYNDATNSFYIAY